MLTLHYPSNGHHTGENSVLLVGQTIPGDSVELTVNGQKQSSVQVSPAGYIGASASLTFGENTIELNSSSGKGSVSQVVHRLSAAPPSQASIWPARIGGIAGFSSDINVEANATQVALKGEVSSPASQLSWETLFSDSVSKPALASSVMPMVPAGTGNAVLDSRVNLFGQLHRTEIDRIPLARCWFSSRYTLAAGVQQLTVLADGQPVGNIAIDVWPAEKTGVVVDETACRTAPTTNANRYKPLLVGSQVTIIGQITRGGDTWVAVRLPNQLTGWLQAEGVEVVTGYQLQSSIAIRNPLIVDNNVLRVEVATAHPPAGQWQTTSNDVIVTLDNTVAQCDVIKQPNQGSLHLAQTGPVTTQLTWQSVTPIAGVVPAVSHVVQDGSQPPVAGSSLSYALKLLPVDPKQWRILLDPGHGGSETGATAPNGQTEAVLNLGVAKACQAAMLKAGFTHVDLSRLGDVDVSLGDRVQQVERGDYHVCLSLHHNALPDGRDPFNHQGLAVFYYHGHARPLAEHLATTLAENLNAPLDGLYWDNLAMTRVHSGIGILIEWGYLTHPEDAERVLADGFANNAADALVNSLWGFNSLA
jgi:N-acetylmuramoyl-L-alanine amidase